MSWIEMFGFPLSVILMAAYLVGILLIGTRSCGGRLHDLFISRRFYISVTAVTIVLLAIEGTWSIRFEHNAIFLAVVLSMMTSTALSVAEGVRQKKALSFILSHAGFFLILFGAFWGAPDFQEGSMTVTKDKEAHIATMEDGSALPLPWTVQLIDFNIERYPGLNSAKQYTSTISVEGKALRTSVNHPARHKGWLIYQSGFDEDDGNVSILKFVRDPWLPLVFLGMVLSAAGALLSLRKVWNSRLVLILALVLSVAFTILSVARISLATLAPALRSLWFIPHLAIYMQAYSLLAIALVTAIVGLGGRVHSLTLSHQLLRTASSLLLIGMLCGAVWAKYAWGDYWTWDAKECWAAATWLITIAGTHIPSNDRKRTLATLTALAFLSMQVTWYGVNYLPSSSHSLHSYTAPDK